jgi:hypothetical protein
MESSRFCKKTFNALSRFRSLRAIQPELEAAIIRLQTFIAFVLLCRWIHVSAVRRCESDRYEKPEARKMKRMLGAVIVVALAALTPVRQAAAQDPLAGAIVGGAVGGIIGGAIGHGAGGAVAGAVIGATAGAAIASEGERRRSGYYWWHGGCYYRYPNGSWLQVQPGYCS